MGCTELLSHLFHPLHSIKDETEILCSNTCVGGQRSSTDTERQQDLSQGQDD